MFRISWGIALSATIVLLVGVLILTRDLNTTSHIFRDGVAQARIVDETTDEALDGAAELPPANTAIDSSEPEVVAILDSLTTAEATLGTLAGQLSSLGTALTDARPPLVGIVDAGRSATDQAAAAALPAANIASTLTGANDKARRLGPLLDQTAELGATIDSKLRIALLLPVVGE